MKKLSNDNYFSPEAQKRYMGSTQFKAFMRCESAALAELEGRYVRPKSTALLVGGYVDAYFEGSLDDYKARNPEIIKRDGSLKSEFVHAEKIIKRLEQDELYMMLMSGQKQKVFTGKIAGVPYKIKVDSLLDAKTCQQIADKFPGAAVALGFCDGAIVDQKIMKDTEDVWNEAENARVSFVRAFGYEYQGAIYQAIEGHMLPFILAVGTKEEEPDMAALYIPDQELSAALETVKEYSPRFQAIKKHMIRPSSCGKCPWCRSQKKLTNIIDFRELNAND